MLFNVAGYRLVVSLLADKATHKLDALIDAGNYDDASLIEIKIPLSMPYQDRQTDFERHYGEITVEGKVYAYVKMKIDGDQLVLKCLPNSKKQSIKTAADNLAKVNSNQDMEQQGKKHSISFTKVFSSDYDDKNQVFVLQGNGILNKAQYFNYTASLLHVMIQVPHQPPKC
jgi:hypothetical protein